MTTRAEQQRLDRLNCWTCRAPGCAAAAISVGAFPMQWWHVVQRGGPGAWLCSLACVRRWLEDLEGGVARKGGATDG